MERRGRWGRRTVWVGLLAVLAGCGNLPAEEPKRVDETTILLSDSRFSAAPVAIFATETLCGRKESVVWKGDAGIAQMILVGADHGCIVQEPLEDEQELALKFKWLQKTGVRFEGPPMKYDTRLGVVWGRRFVHDDRECYFIRHAFEPFHTSYYYEPTAFLVGFFCGQPGRRNDDASIRQFVSGISLREKPVGLVASTIAPAPEQETSASGNQLYPYSPEADVVYSLSGKWAGVADLVTGTFDYKRREKSGQFELSLPGAIAPCRGYWQRTGADANGFTKTGRWGARCPGVPEASGTFRYGSMQSSEMHGADNEGHFIQFSLLAPKIRTAEPVVSAKDVPVTWDGVVPTRTVTLRYANKEGPGGLSFQDRDGTVDCKGGWYLDGRWSADCSNGRKLAGRSFRFQFGTILGTGTDDLGHKFRFGAS